MKKFKVLKTILINIAIIILLLILIEGITNFIFFFNKIHNAKIPAESIYTEYDKDLGWISKKNQEIKNMYGKNISLITNSQRFRNSRDISVKKPKNRKRWIYVGDSFTFGYGVDNDHCYCSYVSKFRPEIEYVNMGQGGYGCDQMYIWYTRDGVPIEHDVLVFAFITDDIGRMLNDRFNSYPKPYIKMKDGEIELKNIPVPGRPYFMSHYPRLNVAKEQLGINWLGGNIASLLNISEPEEQMNQVIEDQEEFSNVVRGVFNNLNDELISKERTAIFVFLPKMEDYYQNKADGYRAFLNENARYFNWNYIDLIEEFRKIDPGLIQEMFIQEDVEGYVGSKGHYTKKGNEIIAKMLISKIEQDPELRGLLDPND